MNAEQRRTALEQEASRIKARLDRLEAQIAGDQDAWFHITEKLPDTVAEVTVDKVLAEARQQAIALNTIVRTLATLSGEKGQEKSDDPEDELKRKRKEREQARGAGHHHVAPIGGL